MKNGAFKEIYAVLSQGNEKDLHFRHRTGCEYIRQEIYLSPDEFPELMDSIARSEITSLANQLARYIVYAQRALPRGTDGYYTIGIKVDAGIVQQTCLEDQRCHSMDEGS